MTIQRFEVAVRDNHGDLTISALGAVAAGHVVRVEYDDTARTIDLHLALVKAAERILTLEQ